MDIKLSAIIGIIVSFLLSLFINGVRSFLVKLPSRILKYFRDKNFKHCTLFFNDIRDIKELGRYCFCSLDNKTYIMNPFFLPSETIENKSSFDLQLSFRETEIVEKITSSEPEFETHREHNLTNKQMIEILDKFFYINEYRRHCFLSETIYGAIRNKLQKRKIHLIICINNERFQKIPFSKLSERDFNRPDSKLSIELRNYE